VLCCLFSEKKSIFFQNQYRLGDDGIKSSPAMKDLGVLMGVKLDMSQQSALAARRPTVSWAASKAAWQAG